MSARDTSTSAGKGRCCLRASAASSTETVEAAPEQLLEADRTRRQLLLHQNNNTAPSFPRRGAVDLEFRQVTYSARVFSKQKLRIERKQILTGLSGEFRAGELTAIMGPSGAGKSSLLNILAGFKQRGAGGQVLYNGEARRLGNSERFSALTCYIMQDDHLRSVFTARESMNMASSLKLGCGVSPARRQEQVEELLEMLGLTECRNTRCSRLSGGQRKRLSIALELINNPPVIFLDEPTTGLDSSSCSQCVSLLKLLAREGRTIVCTIHQPSALIFEMFDHLYTLARGRCFYQGDVAGLLPFLGQFGLHCPPYHNPADYLMDVATGDFGADVGAISLAAEGMKREKLRPAIAGKEEQNHEQNGFEMVPLNDDEHSKESENSSKLAFSKPASMWLQFLVLYRRKWTETKRDYFLVMLRIMTHVIIGLVFGYLYRGVGSQGNTVLANYVYMYGTVLFLIYTGKMPVMLMFPLEFQIVIREYFNRWYSLPPYLLSITLLEIPIQVISSLLYLVISYVLTDQIMDPHRIALFFILCIASSICAQGIGYFIGVVFPIRISVMIGPTIAVLFSMFGFNLFYRDIPWSLRWMFHISYFRAAFQGCIYSMYGYNRSTLDCEVFYCQLKFPSKILEELDVGTVDVWSNFTTIVVIAVVMHVATVAVVWFRLNKR
ncbi:ATP-binding cassette sub-family G member 1-like [Bacillus rossius redtenbacheri]|uniref:ATP-binding cassette sub-family G member 1-like n=1 Tax=Bacillus rossius redtenbacheri TaxID=93214 RepID=UPI002FDEB80D